LDLLIKATGLKDQITEWLVGRISAHVNNLLASP
jgi:hypothetical protein